VQSQKVHLLLFLAFVLPVLGSNEVKVTRYCVKVTFIYFYL